ncbi:hypothetical protein PENSPDRAFT_658960 [Peniophora sp. CONT]|nr:hypothetical protein PENSPDRAFT_658960 [Peniophora sp. CONT]
MERALVSYDDIQPGPVPSLPQPPVAGPSVPTGPNQQQGQPPRKKRRNNKQNRGNNNAQNNNAHVQNSNANVNGFNAGYAGNGWGNRQPQMHAQAHWDDPMHAGYPQAAPPQLPAHPQSFPTQHQHLPPKPQTSLPAKPLPTQPRAMQVEQEYIGGEEEEGYAEEEYEGGEEEEGEEEMSRMLSREEVWDDSALIDAWEAATAEYEAMHGKSKDWKNEPVKKWYNVPPKPSPSKAAPTPKPEPTTENSQPFDYNTFVPSHDPSLAYDSGAVAGAKGAGGASRDEAFEQAVNATYWAGYWTAVYYSHNRADTTAAVKRKAEEEEVEGEYVGEEAEEDDEAVIASPIDEDIIPTQR